MPKLVKTSRPARSLASDAHQGAEPVRATRLPNGVSVVTENLPDMRSASLGIYLDIGSRDETERTNGLAHLYEHMVFKGTQKYSPLQIVQCFEASGGQINAYTSKEQTCLHAKVVDSEVESGMRMLLSMALDSHFDAGELKKEKEVIVEEIHSVHDNPEEHVYELFSEAVFGTAHPLGRPIAGTDKSVRGLRRDDLLAHQELTRKQVPVLITSSGKVSHEALVQLACKAYKVPVAKSQSAPLEAVGWMRPTKVDSASASAPAASPAKAARNRMARDVPSFKPRHLADVRKVQQCNVMLGVPIFGWEDERRTALYLLNLILGDGMSSRLFQSVREERGLVYSIYSNPEFMIGCGVFSIGFATEAGDLPKAIDAISGELRRLKKEGLPARELSEAKRNLRGSVLLGLESTNTRMGSLARQVCYGSGIDGVDGFLRKVDAVSTRQVQACIDTLFQRENWCSAIVGPKAAKIDVAAALRF